ncbi:MAG: dethiobiotin synthase, partial [Mesorhizobium sp.]
GGLMVPVNRSTLYIDVFARWRAPVVLCARTGLGTINHTLLSIEALRARSVPLLGVAFIGDEMADTQRTIAEMGKVRVLGRLPRLDPITPEALAAAMRTAFSAADFMEASP